MQKFQKLFISVAVFLSVAVGLVVSIPSVSAFEVREEKNLEKEEVIIGDLFITGETVKVAGTVNGNLFVTGASVEVTGKVTGNVFAAGSMVYISGEVGRSVFAGASSVDVSGSVARDVFIGAGQVNLSGKVTENAFVGAGSLHVKSDIVENLYAGAGQVTVLGTVGKDAFVSAGSASLDKSQVKGILSLQLESRGYDEVTSAARKEEMRLAAKKAAAGMAGFAFFMKTMMFVGMFLFGLFILKYFPVYSAAVEKEVKAAFGKNFGIGLLVTFAAPIMVVVLLITLIGIPFALAIVAVLSAVTFVAQIWVSNLVGKYIFGSLVKKEVNAPLTLLVGQTVVALICMLPFIGALAKLVMNAVVLGAVVTLKLDKVNAKKA